MDHVIERLEQSKRVFEGIGEYPNAVRCIENAIKELQKYKGETVSVLLEDKKLISSDSLE